MGMEDNAAVRRVQMIGALVEATDQMNGEVRKARLEGVKAANQLDANLNIMASEISNNLKVQQGTDKDTIANVENFYTKWEENDPTACDAKASMSAYYTDTAARMGLPVVAPKTSTPKTPHKKKRSRKPKQAASNTKSPTP